MKARSFKTVQAGLGFLIAVAAWPQAHGAEDEVTANRSDARSPAVQSVQPDVNAKIHEKALEKRKKILDDALRAVEETRKALKALDEGRNDEALAALEKVTGKLELILALDPDLALVPVDVKVVTYDVRVDVETVKKAIEEARRLLDEGEVQSARRLVATLASEIIFRTLNIPMATYPDTIKTVAPLIDQGKIDEAKATLESVLGTLVVTEDIVALPVLRARLLLKDAETLAAKENRSDEDNEKLAADLAAAREQIRLAEVLGYGKKEAFDPIYNQIDEIEAKSSGGKSGTGWFDEIKRQLSELL
ncbi:MAG: hypothetical protein D6826_05960 [Alphaproteobacteria bacterium]|nr:MAG: hypothetical protein D6826_05960 [Alphaproteobacteria bacterium]